MNSLNSLYRLAGLNRAANQSRRIHLFLFFCLKTMSFKVEELDNGKKEVIQPL